MPDALFAHPRLALVYDTFDGERDDLAAYVAIADKLGARRVLDVGCGTGSLAVQLATKGRTVVGIDPAAASLAMARTKDPRGRVTWQLGDATQLPDMDADLVTMTGNVAQVFLGDDDWTHTLLSIRKALRPGGHLVFETRRPERRAWTEWDAHVTKNVPAIGDVELRREVTAVRLPFVSFHCVFRFLADGAVLTSDTTLRFRSREEVAFTLKDNGFTVLDVRQAPDRPDREFVFIARRD